MDSEEKKRLKYRRQYVLSPSDIICPFTCSRIQLNNGYTLFTHQDLPVTDYVREDIRLILLGDIFDYKRINSNAAILEDLMDKDFEEILKKSFQYMGKYVIIFQQGLDMKLFHDAMGTRKIFYTHSKGHAWFCSQPYLLANILSLPETKIPSKLLFYNSDDFIRLNHSNIGNFTLYDDILQLLPGHYYDVHQTKPIRYWPSVPIQSANIDDTAQQCSVIIRGYMANITDRYQVMLPVTSGKDSRLLLAATKSLKNPVYYYINKESHLNLTSKDIYIPDSLLKKLGLDFHIEDPYAKVDKDFEKIYFENNHKASRKFLPIIYNYYLKFGDRINLPGNIAFEAFFRYKFQYLKLTAANLAKITQVDKYEFARDYFVSWLINKRELCEHLNIHPLILFYSEERITNRISQIQSDKEIAQEEYNVYNSRLLIELFLSVDYRLLMPPDYIFHKKVIKLLWPGVLQEPMNPSSVNQIKKIMEYLGLLNLIYKRNRIF